MDNDDAGIEIFRFDENVKFRNIGDVQQIVPDKAANTNRGECGKSATGRPNSGLVNGCNRIRTGAARGHPPLIRLLLFHREVSACAGVSSGFSSVSAAPVRPANGSRTQGFHPGGAMRGTNPEILRFAAADSNAMITNQSCCVAFGTP